MSGSVPIVYKLFPDENALIAWVKGPVTFEQIYAFVNTILQDNDFIPGMNCFYDLTQCTDIDGDLDTLSAVTQMINEPHDSIKNARTAFVLPEHNNKVVNMVQGLVLMISASIIDHHCYNDDEREAAFDFVGFRLSFRAQIEDVSNDIHSASFATLAEHGFFKHLD